MINVELKENLRQLRIEISEAQQQTLLDFITLLTKWNQAYNLTAIKDPDEMITHHLLDSLAIAPFLEGERILDVGSGAGLPGIPLAVTYLDKQFVLMDSNGKKTRFLTQAISTLKLKNVAVVQARVEKFSDPQGFDAIIGRAFAEAKTFIKLTKHLLKSEGHWLLMKGPHFADEIKNIDYPYQAHPLKIPGLAKQRYCIIIEGPKRHPTGHTDE